MIDAPIERLQVRCFEIPTDSPESDGTLLWRSTTLVLVELSGGGRQGLGYTYAHASAGELIRSLLADVIVGRDAMDIPGCSQAMVQAVRNFGRQGIAACAVSAVDNALWDLKARLLEVSVADLLGRCREAVDIYGSGGFTSMSERALCEQLAGWVKQGIPRVKMKVGRHPDQDLQRVEAGRRAIGSEAHLFVDANGAYDRKQALHLAHRYFERSSVSWFEEPVSSDDLEGMRLIRDRGPAGMDITSGEYGWGLFDLRRMLEAGAVDVLMPDATRCLGITGFMATAALCASHNIPVSSHCAPALHVHTACSAPLLRHTEYFHDHVRVESLLFDGVPEPQQGRLAPRRDLPGLGLTLKEKDAARYAI